MNVPRVTSAGTVNVSIDAHSCFVNMVALMVDVFVPMVSIGLEINAFVRPVKSGMVNSVSRAGKIALMIRIGMAHSAFVRPVKSGTVSGV